MARPDKEDRKPPRTGSVAADDSELAKWLHVLWARDTPPEKLEVWQIFNPNASVRGKMIHQTVFKANSKYTIEDCVKLANEILAASQNDCNCVGRKSQYEIAVIDFHQRSNPLVRRLGPLFPRQQSLILDGARSPSAGGDDEDDDGLAPGMKPTAERYLERLMRHLEAKEQGLNRVLGDILIHQQQTAEDLRTHNRQLQEASFQMFLQLQDAMDRKDDRATARAMTDLKVEFIRDGRRLGRNLLLGLFGPDATTDRALPPAQQQPTSAAAKVLQDMKTKVDSSLERTLIDGFLTDCEQAGLLEKLCGAWDDNGPIKDKPGVLTPEQVTIMLRVRAGAMPVDAIDEILPGYKGKHEISVPQVVAAAEFLPESIQQALLELKNLRDRRRATFGDKPQS